MSALRRPLRVRLRLVGLVLLILGVFGGGLLGLTILVLDQQLPQASGHASGVSVVVPATDSSTPGVSVSDDPGSSSADQPNATGVTVVVPDGSELEEVQPQLLHMLIIDAAVVLVGGIVLAGLLMWWQADRIFRPLRRMGEASRQVTAQTLSERVPVDSEGDEFAQLATELNVMLDRLETGYRQERMVSSAVSHELYGPMAAQRTFLEVTLGDPDADAVALRHACEVVLEQNRRLERILKAVLAFGRARTAAQDEPVPLRIDDAVTRILSEASAGVGEELVVTTQLAKVTLGIDPVSVEALLRNLITNAFAHNIAGGWVKVELAAATSGKAILTVTNSCAPLDRDELAELSKPFRRGDSRRSAATASVGLGLTIVDAISRAHGWPTTIDSPETGVFFVSVEMHQPE